MKHIKSYKLFESLSEQRLYHFTNLKNALKIIGDYHLLNSKEVRTLSLTRNPNLISINNSSDVIFCINKDILKTKFKIYPYDYFIVNKREYEKKFSPNRVEPFEYEEALDKDIINLNKYLLYINFDDINYIKSNLENIKKYSNEYKIQIRVKNKIININGDL
jgi:hypothetical protein